MIIKKIEVFKGAFILSVIGIFIQLYLLINKYIFNAQLLIAVSGMNDINIFLIKSFYVFFESVSFSAVSSFFAGLIFIPVLNFFLQAINGIDLNSRYKGVSYY